MSYAAPRRAYAALAQALDFLAVVQPAAQSHAAPSDASDGVDVTGWRDGAGYSPDVAEVAIDGDTSIAIAPGAYLAGYCARAERWRRFHSLAGGAAIALTAAIGYVERVRYVGTFDRLAIVTEGDAGTHLATITPVEVFTL